MWGFLAPAALFGLSLLGIPILLHLLKPRKVRQTPFTSLRWLRESQHRLSRRIRWHQVLLFLMRAGLLTALVFALARPFIAESTVSGKADRFVIVDFSRSMQYEAEPGRSALEQARRVATQLAGQAGPGDRTTVILNGARPQPLGPLTTDPGRYFARLRTAPALPVDAPLTKALGLLPALSNSTSRERIELFFITDNYADTWNPSEIQRYLQGVQQPLEVNVVDLGPTLTANAWIADARLIETADHQSRKIRVQVASSGARAQRRTLRLTRVGTRQSATQNIEINPGASAEAEFEISADAELAGNVAQLELQPADGLSSDDKFLLNLDNSAALNVLVVESDVTQVAELQPGYHLRTALQALGESQKGTVNVARRKAGDSLAQDIARADAVFLVDVPSLHNSDVAALRMRIAAGGGLVVFLGPSLDASFYNSQLAQPLAPQQALLPAQIQGIVQIRDNQTRHQHATNVEWAHPLFQGLSDPAYGSLGQANFNAYCRLQTTVDARTLARIADQPFAVERLFGAGRVLLFNTTANDAWGDLPRRSVFVPLVDNMLRLLTRGPQRRMFAVGDEVTLPVTSVSSQKPVVVSPTGKQLAPAIRTIAGQPAMQLSEVTETGVYQVHPDGVAGRASYPFVVQPSGADSLLVKTDPALLRSWWNPAKFRLVDPEPKSGQVQLSNRRYFIEPWLVMLACAFMLSEMFLVHWLCPKANPRVMIQSPVMGRAHASTQEPRSALPLEAAGKEGAGV